MKLIKNHRRASYLDKIWAEGFLPRPDYRSSIDLGILLIPSISLSSPSLASKIRPIKIAKGRYLQQLWNLLSRIFQYAVIRGLKGLLILPPCLHSTMLHLQLLAFARLWLYMNWCTRNKGLVRSQSSMPLSDHHGGDRICTIGSWRMLLCLWVYSHRCSKWAKS